MALTDTFTKQVKHTGKPAGDKYTDGDGMYLLVKAGGKYWRMDYTFEGKRKTLALGVYSEVRLADARVKRDKARKLLAKMIDPNAAKQEEKQAIAAAAANTFEAVPRVADKDGGGAHGQHPRQGHYLAGERRYPVDRHHAHIDHWPA